VKVNVFFKKYSASSLRKRAHGVKYKNKTRKLDLYFRVVPNLFTPALLKNCFDLAFPTSYNQELVL